jgi:hypothetical protein
VVGAASAQGFASPQLPDSDEPAALPGYQQNRPPLWTCRSVADLDVVVSNVRIAYGYPVWT